MEECITREATNNNKEEARGRPWNVFLNEDDKLLGNRFINA